MLHLYGLDLESAESKFKNLKNNIVLVLFTRETKCDHCKEAKKLFERLASITKKIEVESYNFAINEEKDKEYGIFAVPALAIVGEKDYGIHYYGYPRGVELNNFLDDIVYVSRGENTLTQAINQKLKQLDKQVQIKIFISMSCPYSLPAAKLCLKLAVASDKIQVDIINSTEFFEVAEKYRVRGIPYTVVNEEKSFYGALDDEEYIDNILEMA